MLSITAIQAELIRQYDKAVDDFRATPSAGNYATLSAAMLACQQLSQAMAEQRQRILAMCEEVSQAKWPDIVVEVVTGKDMRTLLREPTI